MLLLDCLCMEGAVSVAWSARVISANDILFGKRLTLRNFFTATGCTAVCFTVTAYTQNRSTARQPKCGSTTTLVNHWIVLRVTRDQCKNCPQFNTAMTC